MEIKIDISDVRARLTRLSTALADSEELHLTMGMGVESAIKSHLSAAGYLQRRNALGGATTSFYKRVHDSTTVEADANAATVSISQRGARLRWLGGEVRATDKLLSLPVHPSAHGLSASLYPGELVFRRAKGGGDTAGYLFARLDVGPVTRDGTPALGPMIYVLRRQTTHQPDPGMLPTVEEMRTAAVEAGQELIEAIRDEQGGSLT